MASDSLDLKYRPQTLDECFGHTKAITQLRGMIKTNKLPNALAFFGPPSAGKTTLARCVAAEINKKPVAQQGSRKSTQERLAVLTTFANWTASVHSARSTASDSS
jgi:DNA polymerase III gamma/tau subunit